MVCHTNSLHFVYTTFPDFECIIGGVWPKTIVQKGMQEYLECKNDRYVAKAGWKLVRDNATGAVIDLVGMYYVLLLSDQFASSDIDECTELPDACCSAAAAATCKGDNCIKVIWIILFT